RRTNSSDIKIYPGAASPLISNDAHASFWHGNDGLGDALTTEERNKDNEFNKEFNIIQAKPFGNAAVEFLVETIMREEPGSVNLLILGPMTNIALALKLEPRIATRVGRVVFMGGSFHAIGNITKVAEFNLFADPEAAHICFDFENGGFPSMEII